MSVFVTDNHFRSSLIFAFEVQSGAILGLCLGRLLLLSHTLGECVFTDNHFFPSLIISGKVQSVDTFGLCSGRLLLLTHTLYKCVRH